MYTPNVSPWREEAQIVRRNLKPLGIDVQVREFALGDFFSRVTRRGEPFDLAVSGYFVPPDPVEILTFLFEGSGIGISHFSDPAVDRKLAAAAKLSGPKRYRAASRLALELQRDLVPAAAFAVTASRDFFSARIGCQVYQPVWSVVLGALACVGDGPPVARAPRPTGALPCWSGDIRAIGTTPCSLRCLPRPRK
jgi:ABC-type transport system substrate-binding protein